MRRQRLFAWRGSEAVEEVENGVAGPVAAQLLFGGGGAVEGSFFELQVGVKVLHRGGDVLMPEPERDDADIVAGDAHVHGPGVAEQVREQAFAGQGWLVPRRGFLVLVQPGLEAVTGQLPPASSPAGGEQRVSGLAAGVV